MTVAIERVANTSCFHRDQGPELSDRSTSCSPMVLGHEMDGVVFERVVKTAVTVAIERVANTSCFHRDQGPELSDRSTSCSPMVLGH
ncbi:hypothetical protein, partial [Tsukamurella spumae]